MYQGPPDPIYLIVLRLQSECPASYGVATKLPAAALDRWKAVALACATWHTGTEVDDIVREQFGAFDAVQRDICSALLRTYTMLMGDRRSDRVFEDGDPSITVPHPSSRANVTAYYQLTLTGASGNELVKIRTGRYGSPPDEVAVLLAGKEAHDSVTEVMLRDGSVETLEMSEEDRDRELARVFGLWDSTQADSWPTQTLVPGWSCYTLCKRPARCGQYPTPRGNRISGNTRTVRMPKTTATWMRRCHRHAAWKQLHQIPHDDGSEFDEFRDRGVAFHDLYAAALLAEDPTSAFESSLVRAAASEAQPLRWLWSQHLALEAKHDHPIGYLATEYHVGITVETKGVDSFRRTDQAESGRPVAVIFMARADSFGLEASGTPAIVEVRTGASAREVNQLEIDIYALGMALLRGTRSVAVHLHALGLPSGPECHREVYDEARLVEALQRLEDPALTVANWDPNDALQATFRAGLWCSACDFRTRCQNYR